MAHIGSHLLVYRDKSTFINVINKLLGLYGTTAASQTLIANGGNSLGDDLVDLISARLITVSGTEAVKAVKAVNFISLAITLYVFDRSNTLIGAVADEKV